MYHVITGSGMLTRLYALSLMRKLHVLVKAVCIIN